MQNSSTTTLGQAAAAQSMPVVEAGATNMAAVTKSDTTADPAGPFRGIVFGGAGIIKLTTLEGDSVTIPSGVLATGIIHPIRFTRVWSATTTATDIWGVK